jgi:ribosome-binding protein aMBF1 (putative translation factor)
MTDIEVLKARALRNPKIKAEYDRLGPICELVGTMLEARHEAGLSQKEVAERMGTTQSVVARLEGAHHLPSLDLVTRYAAAVGRRVNIQFIPAS